MDTPETLPCSPPARTNPYGFGVLPLTSGNTKAAKSPHFRLDNRRLLQGEDATKIGSIVTGFRIDTMPLISYNITIALEVIA